MSHLVSWSEVEGIREDTKRYPKLSGQPVGRQTPLGKLSSSHQNFSKLERSEASLVWCRLSISALVFGSRRDPLSFTRHAAGGRFLACHMQEHCAHKDIPGLCFGFSVDSGCAGLVLRMRHNAGWNGKYEILCFINAKGCVLRQKRTFLHHVSPNK